MSNNNIYKNLMSVYRQNKFPVLQNRVHSSAEEARNCILGDIDINYSKQDKFLPVTGLKVYSPSQGMRILKDGATVYVMNSNYLAEIKEMTNHRFNYKEANQ